MDQPVLDSREQHPLVGRSAERDRIQRALEAVRRGERHLIIVRGEAGLGKTRLLDELAGRAAQSGFRVLRSRADRFDARVPFAALRLALDGALRAEDGPRYEADARRLLSSLDFRRQPQADAAGAQIFELIHRVLAGWAERTPTVLALDDVHAADPDTLAALGFIGRHLHDRLLIAVTTRVRPPDLDVATAAVLDRLATTGDSTQIELSAFDREQTAELLEARVGRVADDVVDRIWSSTRGNLFYTVELARSLEDRGLLVDAEDGPAELADDAEMSVNRAATVLDRILRLGSDVEVVARAISVLPTTELDDLSWVKETTGLPPASVEAAFDALVGAGVLTASRRRYEFAHPIVRETVHRHLGPTERVRLHRSVATFRLAQRDLGRAIDISDIARHLQLAEATDDVALHAFNAAGDRSLSEAPRTSLGWYRDALAVTPPSSPHRGTTLARLARALLLVSRSTEAAEAAAEALEQLERGPDYAHTVYTLFSAYQSSGQFGPALELVNDYADDADVMTPRLIAQWAQVLLWHDRLEDAEWVLVSLASARAAGTDPLVEGARLNMLWSLGLDADARELARQLADTLDESSGLRRAGTLVALASGHAYNGYPVEASRWLAELEDSLVMPDTVGAARLVTAFAMGDWDRALDIANDLDPVDPDYPHALRPLILGAVAMIHAERGDLDAARAASAVLTDSSTFGFAAASAASIVELADGDLDAARSFATVALERHLGVGRLGAIGRPTMTLVEIELAAGDSVAAREVVDRVDAVVGSGPNCRDDVLLAIARCLVGGDPQACLDAAELAGANGLAFERACALAAGGRELGDADALIEAATVLRRLGASSREREVIRSLRALGRRMPRRQQAAGGLTPNEHRLAELVTDGLTNRQIAAELHLSPKTIEVYLTRLYAKTGCKSRVDLAVAMKTGTIDGVPT